MTYRVNINSNIINERETRKTISETMDHIAYSLSKSLGPYGSTTIIKDIYNVNHTISKDGFTILGKLKFENEISATILEIIKNVSKKLVREVGDGSTSSIIVANSLFQELNKLFNSEKFPRKLALNFLKELEIVMEELIKEKAKPVESMEIIKQIATVSNNNDAKLGKLIADIYSEIGKDGFINLELSSTTEDSFKILKGFEMQRGYINDVFANKPDKTTCELEDVFVLMINDTVEDDDMQSIGEIMGNICLGLKKDLLIIAKGYSSEIRNFFYINKSQNKRELNNICVIEHSFASKHRTDSFEDLAAYLGADIIDKLSGEKLPEVFEGTFLKRLGHCKKVIVTNKETRIIEGKAPKERIEEREKLIQDQMQELLLKDKYTDIETEMYDLKKRLADLNSLTATVYVGGDSDLEKETRKYLLEDSVYACKSALQHGYVIGGNLIIPMLIEKHYTEIIQQLKTKESLKELDRKIITSLVNCVLNAFTESFLSVLTNKYENDSDKCNEILEKCINEEKIYNLMTNEFENIDEACIINSSKTDLEIMKSTFSIIGLIVTSNQFISTQTKE